MRIKLSIPRATVAGAQKIGDVIDVSPEEAKRLIDAHKAEPVGAAAVAETPKPIETAMLEGGKPRPRRSKRRKRNESAQ